MDRLSNNRDIIIKPADKGGATVILNTTDYLQGAKRQLDNDTYYKRIEEDCTSGHEQTINQCIDDLVKNGEIQRNVGELLKPGQSRTPIFYMLPQKNIKSITLADQLSPPLTATRRRYQLMWMNF